MSDVNISSKPVLTMQMQWAFFLLGRQPILTAVSMGIPVSLVHKLISDMCIPYYPRVFSDFSEIIEFQTQVNPMRRCIYIWVYTYHCAMK